MPTLTVPHATHYIPAPATAENCEQLQQTCRSRHLFFAVDYADLAVIDLSKAADAQGSAELAIQVRDAMRTHGFFYVVNHGYTSSQVNKFVGFCLSPLLILM
jgi:hypothetical protein